MGEEDPRDGKRAAPRDGASLQPSGGQTQEKVQHFGEHSAFGRPGQPVEFAPVYVLLASQEASFTTGEVYGVTSGAGIA